MKTDIPLKRLTWLRPADLFPLLGITDAEVVTVEILELPASSTSLDTVLRLRRADGQEYLHLIEWQGYRDGAFLWRTLSYVAWMGQNQRERPVLVTIIYLTPEDDVGDTLRQELPGQPGWTVTFPCIRLWEQDAAAALASGLPGLVTLTPLMRGATEAMVEAAAQILLTQVPPPAQFELLAALGVFAEPLISTERFVRLVTKERLMASDLLSYLMKEKIAEYERELAAKDQQLAASALREQQALQQALEKDQQLTDTSQQLAASALREQQALQQALEDVLRVRFPDTPLATFQGLHQITDHIRLQQLFRPLTQAPDVAAVVQLLTQAVAAEKGATN